MNQEQTLASRFGLPLVEDALVVALVENAVGQILSSWDGSALSVLDYAEEHNDMPDHAIFSEGYEFMEAEDFISLIESSVSSIFYFIQGLQRQNLLPVPFGASERPQVFSLGSKKVSVGFALPSGDFKVLAQFDNRSDELTDAEFEQMVNAVSQQLHNSTPNDIEVIDYLSNESTIIDWVVAEAEID